MTEYMREHNTIRSSDNITFNLDELKPLPGKNILFITGYPGSGKTTMINEIKMKYDNVEIISMDYLWVTLINVQQKRYLDTDRRKKMGYLVCKYVDTVLSKDIDRFEGIQDWEDPRLVSMFEEFLIWLVVESKKSYMRGRIVVIEGTQIITLKRAYLQNKPLIITGTSLIKSYIRKAKRDVIPDLDWNHIKKQFNMIPVYKKYSRDLDELIEYMRTKNAIR